jgi:hypothetical protein
MSDTSLLLEPFLDDDEDVRLVQRYASAGARTGARVGSVGGPVGAGVGAGVGGAAGFFVGYGVTGVDPSERATVGPVTDGHTPDESATDDDGPVSIPVTEADS